MTKWYALHFYFSRVIKALLAKLKMPNLLELIWKDEFTETNITLFSKWPATLYCLFKANIWFSKIKCVQWFEVIVIVRFVDIGGIAGHHPLNLLFIILKLWVRN